MGLRRGERSHIVSWLLGSVDGAPSVIDGGTVDGDNAHGPRGILGQGPGHRTALNIGLHGKPPSLLLSGRSSPLLRTFSTLSSLFLSKEGPRSLSVWPLLSTFLRSRDRPPFPVFFPSQRSPSLPLTRVRLSSFFPLLSIYVARFSRSNFPRLPFARFLFHYHFPFLRDFTSIPLFSPHSALLPFCFIFSLSFFFSSALSSRSRLYLQALFPTFARSTRCIVATLCHSVQLLFDSASFSFARTNPALLCPPANRGSDFNTRSLAYPFNEQPANST